MTLVTCLLSLCFLLEVPFDDDIGPTTGTGASAATADDDDVAADVSAKEGII